MKFGEYLRSQQLEEWKESYLDYDKLKKMIKHLEETFINSTQNVTGEKGKICMVIVFQIFINTNKNFRYFTKYSTSNKCRGYAESETGFCHLPGTFLCIPRG